MHADIAGRPITSRGNDIETPDGSPTRLADHPIGFSGSLALAGIGVTGIPAAVLTHSAPLGALVALATAGGILTASVMIGG
ncbi:hypothetical protein I0Q12_13135 [Rhodococcus sp. CX]|uniref:hypothetical protein n=1 Tax=Rhodococcus sp. CX TaxID=2789880 RepID=UPI0018CD5AF5|nr:hypothetical protein [Rhodococcus sp. CX]MBH0120408.1 hypothetical protein [Rhodococcus sp. CX]